MKKLFTGIAIAVIAVAATAAVFFLRGNFAAVSSSSTVNVSNLQQQILSIGELATVEYDYTNVVDSQTSRTIKGRNVPLTKKSFIVALDGTIKIGIDIAEGSFDVNEDTKTVSVIVPKAKILSHEIHEDTLRVLDEKSGLFNPISIEDYTTLAASQKKAMEDKVAGGDMFERAENDAAKMLQTLIEGVVPEEYTVEVTVYIG